MAKQENNFLIKGGRVIDPASGKDGFADVLFDTVKLPIRGAALRAGAAEIIKATGLIVVPGLVDLHTHLREPGFEEKETILTGTQAAVAGGFTTVVAMANTNPAPDEPSVIKFVLEKAAEAGLANVLPVGTVTKDRKGEEISEMAEMVAAGAVAFSDDGEPVVSAEVLRRALEYCRMLGKIIIEHCEEPTMAKGRAMNESYLSTIIGLPAVNRVAEEIMVARDIILGREFGRIHLTHLSAGESVEQVRQAKKNKIAITCDTCPHYFSLTEEAVRNYDTNAKVNPPLRAACDIEAIICGLEDDTIDVISTDHAPHTYEDKMVEFNIAASGISGLETALALVITKLVLTKKLTLLEALAKMTVNPSRILGVDKGTLAIGKPADIVIFDPAKKWRVDSKKFFSKGKNTPFEGWEVTGQVVATLVSGRLVFRDGEILK
jgi:dihydroorotase